MPRGTSFSKKLRTLTMVMTRVCALWKRKSMPTTPSRHQLGPTMADAMETARQIVKTHDDCLCEGADMATLVSRIEAHVLAYAAERERLLELGESNRQPGIDSRSL